MQPLTFRVFFFERESYLPPRGLDPVGPRVKRMTFRGQFTAHCIYPLEFLRKESGGFNQVVVCWIESPNGTAQNG